MSTRHRSVARPSKRRSGIPAGLFEEAVAAGPGAARRSCAQHFSSRSSAGAAGLRTNKRRRRRRQCGHVAPPSASHLHKQHGDRAGAFLLLRDEFRCPPPSRNYSPHPPWGRGGPVFACSGVRGQQREDVLRHDRWCWRDHQLVLCVSVCACKLTLLGRRLTLNFLFVFPTIYF